MGFLQPTVECGELHGSEAEGALGEEVFRGGHGRSWLNQSLLSSSDHSSLAELEERSARNINIKWLTPFWFCSHFATGFPTTSFGRLIMGSTRNRRNSRPRRCFRRWSR